MMVMLDTQTGRPVCSRCGHAHEDRRRNYCARCAELVRVEFGTAHSLRTNTVGDPNRPVRKMEVIP